jgi:phosphoglycolate phosphatase
MPSSFAPLNLIFDLDGTLVDSLPGIASSIQYAVRNHAPGVSLAELRNLVGPPVRQILRKLLAPVSDAQLDDLEGEFRIAYDSWGWKETEAFPSVLDTLQSLHGQGLKLFLFTNKPEFAATKICEALGLRQLFEGMLSKDSKRPEFASKTEMLRALVDQYSLSKDVCLVIGDSQDDYLSAVQLEMAFVHASYGYGRLTRADSWPETWSIDRFSALPEFCGRQNFA